MARTKQNRVNSVTNCLQIKTNDNNVIHESEEDSNPCPPNEDNNNNAVEDVEMDKSSSSDKTSDKTSTTEAVVKITVKVFFIEVKSFGSVGRQPKSMQEAFTSMKTFKFTPNWIKEEDVLEMEWSEGDKYLFVMESFDGRVFDFLMEKKLRIVGPLAVLYCYSSVSHIKKYKTLPEKPFPLFSQCMRKLFVSMSGFDGQRKQEMMSRITNMCGNYCKDFTKKVTHLVTDSVRTKKYKVAKENGVTVVTSQWVDYCWTEGQHNLLSANSKTVIDKYRLKMFYKLLITVSQLDVEEREKVKKIVEENGGEYSSSLKLGPNNSILLLRSPEGQKFKYAHLRGVPCIDIQWLYDSVAKGYAVPEEKYVIRPSSQSSQKTEKILSQKTQNDNQMMNSISSTDCSQQSVTIVPKVSNSKTTDNTSSSSTEEVLVEKMNNLMANRNGESFLEGCDVYIVGFERSAFESIKSALISCGSMVFNEFKNIVTHVVVGPKCVDSELQTFFDNKSCKVVSIDWVYECLRLNECCDCGPFAVKKPNPSITSASDAQQKKKNKSKDIFDGPLVVVCPKKAVKTAQKWREETKLDSERIHKSLGDRLNDKNDIQWDEGEDTPSQRPYNSGSDNSDKNSQTNRSEDKTGEQQKQIEVIEVEDPKKYFLFSGYEDEAKSQLSKIVEELGGEVVDSINDLVTHLVIRDPSATEKTLSAIASGLWVMNEDYLNESKLKGQFAEEEDYEWGSIVKSDSDPKSIRKKILVSAIGWRKRLAKESKERGRRVKVFDNWDVLFLNQTKMTSSYALVLKAGNANVVQMGPDFDPKRLNDVKFVILDHHSIEGMSKMTLKVAKLSSKMEKLHKLDFVSHFLLNGPDFDLTSIYRKSLIRETFWESLPISRKRERDQSEGRDTPLAKHRK